MVSLQSLRAERSDIYTHGCPSRVVLDHVTSKWGVLVLAALAGGTLRWGELRREVDGISEKMLGQTLRILVADGLVERESLPTVPPHVDYRLTDRGRELVERMLPLLAWIGDNADGMLAPQP